MSEQSIQWAENVILADADFIDAVAFDLTVNFERMLNRPIPPADMARWCECVALDGGLRQGEHQTNVVLLHEKATTALRYFAPSVPFSELSGQAFSGPLGEFTFSCAHTEPLAPKEQLFADTLQYLLAQKGITRLMVVPADGYYQSVRAMLRNREEASCCHPTLFAMQPMPSAPFAQEILGYSLMQALGISASELHPE